LEILSSAAAVIAEGEVMQLGAAKNTATTEDDYLAVIRAKTAELFAAACEVGPALAARPKDEQNAFRSFGMNLGIAFQLVDDALDYGGQARQEHRRRCSGGQDHAAGSAVVPPRIGERAGILAAYARGGGRDRRRPRLCDRPDDEAPRARRHHPARTALWCDCHRRACLVSGLADEGGTRRDGRVLHLPLELAGSFAQPNRLQVRSVPPPPRPRRSH